MNAFMVDQPALTPQQHVDTSVTIADTHLRDLFDATAQHGIVDPFRAVMQYLAIHIQESTHPPLAQMPGAAHLRQHGRAARRSYHFFLSTSCRMCRSSVRSATTC